MSRRLVAFSPTQCCVIDYMDPDEYGIWRSSITNENIRQIRQRYPGATLITAQTAQDTIERRARDPMKEITEAQWLEMLNVLPPQDWRRTETGESFKMCEHTNGRITAIYARQGSRYFTLSDLYTLPHSVIMERVANYLAISAAFGGNHE